MALELAEHTDEVYFLEFSHDGTRLATAGKDRSLLIYNTADFSVIHKLEGHSQGVAQFAWSPDDSRIISGSQDNTARVWDTKVRIEVTVDCIIH
jgi:WD40 repeat protein